MKAKKYFDEEYGNDHIKDVVDLKDLESLYGLMQEYADEQLRLHNVSNSLPCGDEVWIKANETNRFNFEDWFDKLFGNDC